ncbi:MAG TPA: GTPase ObgE [Kofleriaceae bacterium]|nr:GTPase ObgE [Kofleriaceae bacterium]
MKFIDEAIIEVKAGDGGNGSAAFRREDGVPHGGPSGGDGGDGGSVVFVADSHLSSLLDFKYRRHYKAERGENGRNKDQYGAAGEDLFVRVPVGTVMFEGDVQFADLAEDGAKIVLAKGGIGGRGNIHFKTAWNQAPKTAEPGTPGQARTVRLELKLLADVGLLGYPNVGKSTFISRVSRARPKIADYPFTTLVPNLGVVQLSDERHFVIADIPGLIEGASQGAGLGHQFLRHVERCRVLLHIVEATYTTGPDRSPLQDYQVLNRELASYAPDLATKPQIVVLNKLDATGDQATIDGIRRAFSEQGVDLLTMSAATGEGIQPVLEKLWAHLARRS